MLVVLKVCQIVAVLFAKRIIDILYIVVVVPLKDFLWRRRRHNRANNIACSRRHALSIGCAEQLPRLGEAGRRAVVDRRPGSPGK